ncbi:hypothetical protein ACJ73_10059 [Blastomyces percursus]|uniref:DDE Tnp4 domain-containing protein n=1 Tax=Blastomyces percursus TaxID=1658174 RepID=A0A1J9Q0Q2_9EURO|nr:hypothetical protein ACJ73_10059 [Blastomyces percursus]
MEGSSHDSRVLAQAQSNDNFTATSGCYFLADVGYKENKGRPANKQELFNLRHASMRSVIESVFGIFKRRFRIYDRAREGYSIRAQVHLFFALAAAHNFLNKYEEFEDELTVDLLENEQEEDIYNEQSEERQDESKMIKKRDEIAEQMWEAYINYRDLVTE